MSSSAFIANKAVRTCIFKKYMNKCAICQAIHSLQIDHIKSVYRCFKDGDIQMCNTYENLQVLCWVCNSKKPL